MASILALWEVSGEYIVAAACASIRARLTRDSVSFAIAVSRFLSADASRDLNTARAASNRLAGSVETSVRPPTAAPIALRTRLLTRTGLRLSGGEPATG